MVENGRSAPNSLRQQALLGPALVLSVVGACSPSAHRCYPSVQGITFQQDVMGHPEACTLTLTAPDGSHPQTFVFPPSLDDVMCAAAGYVGSGPDYSCDLRCSAPSIAAIQCDRQESAKTNVVYFSAMGDQARALRAALGSDLVYANLTCGSTSVVDRELLRFGYCVDEL